MRFIDKWPEETAEGIRESLILAGRCWKAVVESRDTAAKSWGAVLQSMERLAGFEVRRLPGLWEGSNDGAPAVVRDRAHDGIHSSRGSASPKSSIDI